MTTNILTLADCQNALTWALAEVAKRPYQPGQWNAFEFLIKEHCCGSANAGATVYKCAVGFNVDYDLRCDCCGEILAMGSIDIDGPVHGPEDSGPVVVARSGSELAAALGSMRAPPSRTPGETADDIYLRLSCAKPCCFS